MSISPDGLPSRDYVHRISTKVLCPQHRTHPRSLLKNNEMVKTKKVCMINVSVLLPKICTHNYFVIDAEHKIMLGKVWGPSTVKGIYKVGQRGLIFGLLIVLAQMCLHTRMEGSSYHREMKWPKSLCSPGILIRATILNTM